MDPSPEPVPLAVAEGYGKQARFYQPVTGLQHMVAG